MTKNKNIDYLFWITLIVFSNPGGIMEAVGLGDKQFGLGGANLNDYLFVLMGILYISIPSNRRYNENNFVKTGKYLLFFFMYYFIMFGFVTPIINETQNQLILIDIIKIRWALYTIMLFFFTYRFFIRSYLIFFRLLLISSIIIFSIFFFSILLNIEILPLMIIDRGFIDINRNLLLSYGFMPILLPVGVVIIIFKLNIKYQKMLLVGAVMMFLAWLISLTRRHILGSFIYILIAVGLNIYLSREKSLVFIPVFKIILSFFIIIIMIYIIFPSYIDAGIKTVENTIYVVQYGETEEGNKDTRLSFDNEFIINIIKENPVLGTGFDNKWRTAEGDDLGYEASDYQFLSALAMVGVLGILAFLPVYVILIKSLIFDIRFMKKRLRNANSFEFFMLVLFILYFLYILIQYPKWFGFISNPGQYNFMVFLAMYYGSRKIYYNSIQNNILYAKYKSNNNYIKL